VLDVETGRVSWTPTWDDLGINLIAVTVSDGNGGTATEGLTVVVEDRSPAFTTTTVLNAYRGKPYHHYFNATDPEGDRLKWKLDAATVPPGASIGADTGRFSWPSPGPEGQTSVTARVEGAENESASAVRSFAIRVVSPP